MVRFGEKGRCKPAFLFLYYTPNFYLANNSFSSSKERIDYTTHFNGLKRTSAKILSPPALLVYIWWTIA